MNASRLLAEFERLSETPSAVPRLRRLVLDLAIRGKLVAQDPSEGTALALLESIRSAKAKRVEPRWLKPNQDSQKPKTNPPFVVPDLWCWSSLSEVGLIGPHNRADDDSLASFVPMTLIPAEYGIRCTHEVRRWGEIKKGYTHFANGDVGLAKITPCFENGKSTVFRDLTGGIGAGTTELHIVRPVLVNPDYLLIFMKSSHFVEAGIPAMTGTAGQKRVSADYFMSAPLPLPPVGEQRRIVAKVDELLALCGRLEAARSEREGRRDALCAASMLRLTASDGNSAAATADVRFFLDRCPQLITKPEHVAEVRETILDLAVLGRLVSQNPGIESALDERWRPLSEVLDLVTDGDHATPPRIERDEGAIPLVTAKNVRNGIMDFSNTDWVTRSTAMRSWQRCQPATGDILMVCVGATIGRLCVLRDAKEMMLVRSVALLRPSKTVLVDFLAHCLRSPILQRQIWGRVKATGQPCLYLGRIQGLTVPVPRLRQQDRIVAKVAELMAVCDDLEAALAAAQEGRVRLLGALLHNALEGAPLPQAFEVSGRLN